MYEYKYSSVNIALSMHISFLDLVRIFSLVAQIVKNFPALQETQVWSLGREDPLEKEMATQYSCLENSMERGAWQITVHGVTKNWTQLSNTFFFKATSSEISQTEKEKYFMLSLMYVIWKVKQKNITIARLSDIENRLVFTSVEREVGREQEIGIGLRDTNYYVQNK